MGKTLAETVRGRRSVRTFDGRALAKEDAEEILRFAEAAGNPYDLPIEWRILSAKEHGLTSRVITGADTWIAGKLKRVPHAEEAFGFSFERVVLFAEARGIGTTWIAGTMDRAAFERAMELKEDEVMPCVSPLGYAAAKMSVRETVMRKGVRADTRLPFGELFFDGGFDTPLTPEKAGDPAEALELVRLAPSAVNWQPWRVVVRRGERAPGTGSADRSAEALFYEKPKKILAAGSWDLQKIDMGIALCHFALWAEEAGRTLEFVTDDPGLPRPEGTAFIAGYRLA